jgi:PKD repeat protein
MQSVRFNRGFVFCLITLMVLGLSYGAVPTVKANSTVTVTIKVGDHHGGGHDGYLVRVYLAGGAQQAYAYSADGGYTAFVLDTSNNYEYTVEKNGVISPRQFFTPSDSATLEYKLSKVEIKVGDHQAGVHQGYLVRVYNDGAGQWGYQWSDASGLTTFYLVPGSYEYLVEKNGAQSPKTAFTVENCLDYDFEYKLSKVEIKIEYSGLGYLVRVYNAGAGQWGYQWSDASGLTTFYLIEGDYEYLIEKDGAQSPKYDFTVVYCQDKNIIYNPNPQNQPPEVGPITVCIPPDPSPVTSPISEGTEIKASADFNDPDTDDTHTAVWDWGDSSTSAGTISENNGACTVTAQHTYGAAGVYTVTLTVTDEDGNSRTSTYEYVVVYDPDGGFVTGGGWIDSPEGAYMCDPSLTGKASFDFVSKYKKGASVPSGNTEFQFKAGDLNFHSNDYDWLVIAGSKAIFKGTGSINGEGEYKFMLSAIDGDLKINGVDDTFRIKIWVDNGNGSELVIYDNKINEDDNYADPTTALQGGNIVVHKPKS